MRGIPFLPLGQGYAALDGAVDCCYRSSHVQSDRERVEHLFALYEKLTAPLLPAAGKRKRAKKSASERE